MRPKIDNRFFFHFTKIYCSRAFVTWPHLENPRKMCPASMADCGMASLRQKASRPGNLVNGLTEGPRGLVVFLTAPVVSLNENKIVLLV